MGESAAAHRDRGLTFGFITEVPAVVSGDRHSEFDVTNRIRVSSVDAVREAVQSLLGSTYPQASLDVLWIAFHDFRRLFRGRYPGYVGCDTLYHDIQHTLDMTLAMARLLTGYERSCDPADRLGFRRAFMGIVCALFHDAGYIRRDTEDRQRNGAEFTGVHVSRSAEFLSGYLPRLGFEDLAPIAARVVHFTGYEIALDELELDDPRDSLVGHLLGSADLLAQMADRCYLEKCRDRLYGEFVLGGVAIREEPGGGTLVQYRSAIDLLRQTPLFFEHSARQRLDKSFNGAHRYVEALFDGRNPYLEAIEQNLSYLGELIRTENWAGLRRRPPCFTILPKPLETVSGLVSRYLARYNVSAEALAIA